MLRCFTKTCGIPGLGKVVEIDEVHKTSSAKYNRGRRFRKSYNCMFSGIERGSDKILVLCFCIGYKSDRNTFEPLIVRRILPRTTKTTIC